MKPRERRLRLVCQASRCGPRHQCAVVAAVGYPARGVAHECLLRAVAQFALAIGALTSGKTPDVFSVSDVGVRIQIGINALNVDCAARVLEIVHVIVLADITIIEAAQIDPCLREEVDEQRRRVDPVLTGVVPPFVALRVFGVGLPCQRMRGRSRTQHVNHQRLGIACPICLLEPLARLPCMVDFTVLVQHPAPVDAIEQVCGDGADFLLASVVAVKIFCGDGHACQQQSRVDRGQLALLRAFASSHVEKVIVKALVTGGLCILALAACGKELQRRERRGDSFAPA